MVILGNKKRFYIGCWILASLIFLGYNGFGLTSLFSSPLVGRSRGTRLASQKWLRLDSKLSVKRKDSQKNIDMKNVVARFSPDITMIRNKPIPPKLKKIKSEFDKEGETRPPVVTGIIKISDVHGKHRRFALIEGKQLMENDLIRGFAINKITDKGVILIYNDKTLFVPAPEVYYSLDREQ